MEFLGGAAVSYEPGTPCTSQLTPNPAGKTPGDIPHVGCVPVLTHPPRTLGAGGLLPHGGGSTPGHTPPAPGGLLPHGGPVPYT